MLNVGENQFHIDPGPNALMQAALAGVNVRAHTGIFVSQSGLYHAHDVNAVVDAMTYSGLDKRGVIVGPQHVVEPNGVQGHVLLPGYRDLLEKVVILEPGQRVGINAVEIVGLTTEHSQPTLGFKFFTPSFSLVYSGDTRFTPAVAEGMKNANILILNVPHLKKEDAKDNLCINDAKELISLVKPQLAVLTHFGLDMVKADPLYQIREINKSTGIQTIAAKDGMVINPLSYSVDKGQRTLDH